MGVTKTLEILIHLDNLWITWGKLWINPEIWGETGISVYLFSSVYPHIWAARSDLWHIQSSACKLITILFLPQFLPQAQCG